MKKMDKWHGVSLILTMMHLGYVEVHKLLCFVF